MHSWLRTHYAPAWRYRQIAIDLFTLFFAVAVVAPAVMITVKTLWSEALK